MLLQSEAAFLSDSGLALFDFRIVEFLYPSALQTNQVIVMTVAFQFKNGLAAFKMMPFQYARLLKLCQDAIHRRQTDILALAEQLLIDILGR